MVALIVAIGLAGCSPTADVTVDELSAVVGRDGVAFEGAVIPLDDPIFSDRRVAYNSEDIIYATSLSEQYDAIIQYGLAHRMPED